MTVKSKTCRVCGKPMPIKRKGNTHPKCRNRWRTAKQH
jgi:hypothetical protein